MQVTVILALNVFDELLYVHMHSSVPGHVSGIRQKHLTGREYELTELTSFAWMACTSASAFQQSRAHLRHTRTGDKYSYFCPRANKKHSRCQHMTWCSKSTHIVAWHAIIIQSRAVCRLGDDLPRVISSECVPCAIVFFPV